MKIKVIRGNKLKKIHDQIEQEYNEQVEQGNKMKKEILQDLANKYGYASGQSIRNFLNARKKSNK